MALINHAKHEINAKIVYYGPEGCGKRASLQYVYDRIKPSLRGDLKSPAASGDSLFFFDFNPFENPVFGDYRIRFHVYTLPGKVANPAAWKMTLKGADGLVIVADAALEAAAAARDSISALRGFLSAYGVGLHDVPCVLQLNKGNQPQSASAEELAATLDIPDTPTCFSDPASGEGVLKVLSLLSRQIMARIGQDDALQIVKGAVATGGDDAEVSAALNTLETTSVRPLNNAIEREEVQVSSAVPVVEVRAELLQVVLAGAGAVCTDGVVRVPLEFTLGGTTRRLVVSIALDHE